jgi:3-oxoacyl-[acyl-carrier protein] reductase
MDLKIKAHNFLVCGAGNGMGNAIAEALCHKGAYVFGTARTEDGLARLREQFPDNFIYLAGDLRENEILEAVATQAVRKPLHGAVINAGGPPVMSALESSMDDWDDAYRLVVRWKIDLVSRIVPKMMDQEYGRILFIESKCVKQPIPNLVLSNAMRMAIVGYGKTLSQEVARKGVTVNILAPGSHNTRAIERIVKNQSESSGLSLQETRKRMEANIPVGRMGEADEIASLATWLLSGHAGYVTGQTIGHDGGSVGGVFG